MDTISTLAKQRKPNRPSPRLDDEAKGLIDALDTLNGLPGYEGPTVEQVIDEASQAASKAVQNAYGNIMKKAK